MTIIGRQSLQLGSSVLEPYLHLARAEARNLSRQSLAMGSVWVCLSCEFAHQESCLVVR